MNTQENFSCQNTKIDPLQNHREASRSSSRLKLSVNQLKQLSLIGDIKVTPKVTSKHGDWKGIGNIQQHLPDFNTTFPAFLPGLSDCPKNSLHTDRRGYDMMT
jgi:hypothetical protein